MKWENCPSDGCRLNRLLGELKKILQHLNVVVNVKTLKY